jgi:signal transduction histidine kinase
MSLSRLFRKSSDAALGRADLLALAGGLLVLMLIAASASWQANRNVDALSQTARTEDRRELLTAIVVSAQDAERGQRGYLLTGDMSYLDPFARAVRALPGQLDRLEALLPNDPRTKELRAAAQAKVAELQQTIDLVREGDRLGGLAIVRANVGRDLMRRIGALTGAMVQDQDQVLREQAAAIQRGGRLLVWIDIAGLVAVVLMAALIGFGVRGYLAKLHAAQAETARANAQLATANATLDDTVRIRTADLLAANEEIQRFAYIVSHDLRAPLVNIMGFTSELEQSAEQLSLASAELGMAAEQREPLIAETAEALRFIKASTSKMDRLINAILKLSREGRRVLTPERLDMAQVFGGLVESMRHQVTNHDAEVLVGPVPNLVGDRVAIEQIFGNVIDNALKYLQSGRPGVVRIDGRLENGLARFDIADNGRGIAARDYERVFELFRRAGDQTVPGEGIGLAHVRSLVRRIGGSIDCVSTLGEGTTFIIRLPPVGYYTRDATA